MCAQARDRPLRVLIVDDEPDIRMMLRIGLSRSPEIDIAGEAADGVKALELIARGCPDAVLLDIRMPNMDGIEAARQIRSMCSETKIIVLSAHIHRLAAGDGSVPEADLFLEKLHTPLQRLRDAVLEVCA